MADGKQTKLPERSEEAENLAREGLEEIKHGDKAEGDFLLQEARALDKSATDKLIRSENT